MGEIKTRIDRGPFAGKPDLNLNLHKTNLAGDRQRRRRATALGSALACFGVCNVYRESEKWRIRSFLEEGEMRRPDLNSRPRRCAENFLLEVLWYNSLWAILRILDI